MALITKEEILKLAHMSHIELHEDELDLLVKQIENVLLYAQRVQEIQGGQEIEQLKNVNVMREDVSIPTATEPILAQAPEKEERYFVVPKILESN